MNFVRINWESNVLENSSKLHTAKPRLEHINRMNVNYLLLHSTTIINFNASKWHASQLHHFSFSVLLPNRTNKCTCIFKLYLHLTCKLAFPCSTWLHIENILFILHVLSWHIESYLKQVFYYRKRRWRSIQMLHSINKVVGIYQRRSDNNYFINIAFPKIKYIYSCLKRKIYQNIYIKLILVGRVNEE